MLTEEELNASQAFKEFKEVSEACTATLVTKIGEVTSSNMQDIQSAVDREYAKVSKAFGTVVDSFMATVRETSKTTQNNVEKLDEE